MSGEESNGVKRRRVARACDTCRRKKVRCDGVQPGSDPPSCTNCKAYGYECAFIDAPKKRGPPKGYIEALETRLQRMESILGGLVQSGDLPEGTISSNLEWINVNESNFRSAQESNNSTSSRLRKSPSINSTSTNKNNSRNGRTSSSKNLMTSSSSGHKHYKNNGQSSDSEECLSSDSNEYSGSRYDLNDSMGQLAMDESGHTKYLGNSSGVFLLKITKKVANGQIISMPTSDWHIPPIKRIGSSEVLELPPKELCDQLLEAYWKEVHPYMPFIDKQDLMEKYNNLEANYSSIILLYAIFSITARFVNDPSIRMYSEGFPGSVFYVKAKELLKDEFDKASISIVQALLMLSIQIHGQKDSVTWVYIGLAIRLAQDMGLHRDSSKWNFDERQGEVRRRVWWACCLIDRFSSAGLGRPLAINEADCDVDFPIAGKIPDDDNDTIEAWVEMIKGNLILGRILNHVYGIKSKSSQGNVESILASLDNELNEWRDNLPKKFQFDPATMNSGDVKTNRKMFTHLLYYTEQILLHRPHIRGPKSKAPPSSIPSLTICTMAANNITHILYRGMKDGSLKLSGTYIIYSFFTAASMHFINALSGDDRFREVAKHGLRMTLKCLEHMTDYWFATDKLSSLIRDLLKSRNIELEGYSDSQKSIPQKRKATNDNFQGYVKLEDMASEGTTRDKNPFLNCLSESNNGRPRPKITFAPPFNPSTNLNSIEQNQHHYQQTPSYTVLWNSSQQQNMMNNNLNTAATSSSEVNSPQLSTKSPSNDALQYDQTSSPESTTSSPGIMHFTEYLTTDSGLFPQNADAFNPDSSLLFDIDDPMDNNNPFLSLPSTIDWNDWTDWTEYLLRMQSLRCNTSSASTINSNGISTNPVVSNPNIHSTATVMNAPTISSLTSNNNMTY
ncbi:fungal-specific transcription factor domain-containing protein [Glomus cerebriforme]|uniref:Fungal-specific transcription factor domain-containing protein n=1 Tax=Glomus cerebriforme TaxID=658196 RepID=A0A397SF99_9GLOM|nr:fungal-specific transcription factor domain-containing protein [Glomus cerebriforme]